MSIEGLLSQFASQRILVIGDLMLDEYIWGKVSRISPEAPVPVVNVTGETYYPGGAANVVRNVREFASQVAVMGMAGTDPSGMRLVELLQRSGVDTSGVVQDGDCFTTVKSRIIARNQQVVRVDRERKRSLTAEQLGEAWTVLNRAPLPFETSRPGLFAVGDLRAGSTKRVAAAVGEGSAAVRAVHEYLAFDH